MSHLGIGQDLLSVSMERMAFPCEETLPHHNEDPLVSTIHS